MRIDVPMLTEEDHQPRVFDAGPVATVGNVGLFVLDTVLVAELPLKVNASITHRWFLPNDCL